MLAAFLTTICFSISVDSGHRCARALGGLETNFWRLAIAVAGQSCDFVFRYLPTGYLAAITLNSVASKAFNVSVRTLPAAASAARH
jgi:hypothetical protein